MIRFIFSFVVICGICGCASDKFEHGPQGTIAYLVQVETSEPGARIEAENNYIGLSPLTLKIFGDRDGTFHNFGSQEYVVKAYPVHPGQIVQQKAFRTGGWFQPEDKVPTRIYFDLDAGKPPQK